MAYVVNFMFIKHKTKTSFWRKLLLMYFDSISIFTGLLFLHTIKQYDAYLEIWLFQVQIILCSIQNKTVSLQTLCEEAQVKVDIA